MTAGQVAFDGAPNCFVARAFIGETRALETEIRILFPFPVPLSFRIYAALGFKICQVIAAHSVLQTNEDLDVFVFV